MKFNKTPVQLILAPIFGFGFMEQEQKNMRGIISNTIHPSQVPNKTMDQDHSWF